MPDPGRELRVALVVAGGVSLGSFSGGAVAEIVRLLSGWSTRPVRLDVCTGASAGAMVAAVTLRHLVAGRTADELEAALRSCGVTGVGLDYPLRGADGGPDTRQLLPDPEDHDQLGLLSNLPLRTVLEALVVNTPPAGPPSPLVASGALLGLALTNLNGLDTPDRSGVRPGPEGRNPVVDALSTTWHDDRIRFAFAPSADAVGFDEERGARLLGGAEPIHTSAWRELARAALASGAYPGAFAPVRMTRFRGEYGRLWPSDLAGRDRFCFTYADGGLLRNEPLPDALALASLQDADVDCERIVILVDPYVRGPRGVRAFDHELSLGLDVTWGEDGRPRRQRLRRRDFAGQLLVYLTHATRVVAAQARLEPTLRQGRWETPPPVVAITPLGISAARLPAGGFMSNFGGFLSEAWRSHDFELGRRAAAETLALCGVEEGPGISPGVPRLLRPGAPTAGDLPSLPDDGYPSYADAAPEVRARVEEVVRDHARRFAGSRGVPDLLGEIVGHGLAFLLQRFLEAPSGQTRYIHVRLESVAEGLQLAPASGAEHAQAREEDGGWTLETLLVLRHDPRQLDTPYFLDGPHVLTDVDEGAGSEPYLELGRSKTLGLGWEATRRVALTGAPRDWFEAASEHRCLDIAETAKAARPDDLS